MIYKVRRSSSVDLRDHRELNLAFVELYQFVGVVFPHVSVTSEADHWTELGEVDELVGLLASVYLKDLQFSGLGEACDLGCWLLRRRFSDETSAFFHLLQI